VIVLVDPSWDVNTDALGVGVLNGVTPGVPVVVEALEGSTVLRRFQTPLVLEPNETREIDVQLGGGVKILGTAQDQLGKPISGATVWLVNATHEVPLSIDTQHLFQSYEERHAIGKTTTNTNGAFTFDNVAAGEWWLGIAPDTHERMSAMEHRVSSNASYLMIPERAGDVTFTLRATRGLYIRGRVVKPDGSPAPNAFVHASGHRGGWMSDQTDDKGEFAVGPLIEGRYGVYASGTQKLAHSDPTTADAGASGVELRLKAGGAIRGRVIDESGEPCQANISLSRDLNRFDPSDLGRVIVMMTKTHPANEIELEGMEPGTYNLVASTSDGRIGVCGNVNVSAGSETSAVVITLRSTGTLVVKWAKGIVPSNYQIASEGVMIHFGIAVNSGDTGRISVPPGKGTLTYWLESGAVKAREFEVAAGKETEVVLDGQD
jgi:hypothetical protein